MSIGRISILIG